MGYVILIAIIFVTFDDLSIITRLAASSSVLSNCLGSKGIPLRSQAFSNK